VTDVAVPASSVAAPRFGSGPPFSVGVEEEYMLLDPETYELVSGIEGLLNARESGLTPEFYESLLETHTPVCRDLGEVHRELRRLRAHVAEATDAQGLRFGAAGTHPFSLFEEQRITRRDRYRGIADELQYVARRELIFGLHVHVGVDDPDTAITVVRGLSRHLAELIALAASSPLWRGHATGLDSTRAEIVAGHTRAGPPPPMRDYEEFAGVVETLEATGCIDDYTKIWWDVRPHPRLGTVETRVMDAVSSLDDAVALAAYIQCLVHHYAERDVAPRHPLLIAENRWRGLRWGLAAEIIDLDAEAPARIPVARLVRRRLHELAGDARDLGCEAELDWVHHILERGNGAQRQLLVYGTNRDAVDVARDIAEITAQ
jgi:glutamate---cysteine ligase / carboxylate-amine ligase